ncbi:MAG: dual specificity protein phosphatase family protein [Thermoprotei archaeon]
MSISWIVDKKLAAGSIPENIDDLDKWVEMGIRAVMILIEPNEATHLGGMSNYLKELEKRRLEFVTIPIPDFTAPTLETCIQAVKWINEKIKEKMPVLVHCKGGLGRTGTIVACYLISQGMSDEEAINYVRNKRPGSISMQEQIKALRQFYKFIKHKNT